MSGSKRVRIARVWTKLPASWLPFADAGTVEFPLRRLLRLGCFQLAVGVSTTLLTGTLNRVMIVELGVPTALVALMVSVPLLAAPLRALIGYRSDTHQSVLGWRRVPFIWFGSLLQFGGLAIMPFALILLSGDTRGSVASARIAAALAFALVGIGMHTTQTAGLALATDLAPERVRPRAVALLYLMLLVGLVASSLTFGALLSNFSQIRLIQTIQGAAVVTMALNMVALWRQEPRRRWSAGDAAETAPDFRMALAALRRAPGVVRLLVSVALGTAAFGMQDILLEPYGGQILHLSVGATTSLTATAALGSVAAFAIAARMLERGSDPIRVAAMGALVGVAAFASVIFASPLESVMLFRSGTLLIGFGNGLFAVGTLTAVMDIRDAAHRGLALGSWGAVQATSAGVTLAAGGLIRDAVASVASTGALGPAMQAASVPYSVVYHLEIGLLFATLVALGPLVAPSRRRERTGGDRRAFGLAEIPG
jgi:MFS transporter, BCD family, chlorophyll transporter